MMASSLVRMESSVWRILRRRSCQRGAGGVGHFFRRDECCRKSGAPAPAAAPENRTGHRWASCHAHSDRTTGSGLQNCAAWRQFPAIPPSRGCRPFGHGRPRAAPRSTEPKRGLPFLISSAVDGVGLLQSRSVRPQGSSQGCRSCIISLVSRQAQSCTARARTLSSSSVFLYAVSMWDSVSPYSSTVFKKSRLFILCSRWASTYCSLTRDRSFKLLIVKA